MIDELEKKIAWQNINTSEEKNKILSGKAIAIESEKIKLTHEDGKIYEENINCIVVNFKNIKVLIDPLFGTGSITLNHLLNLTLQI